MFVRGITTRHTAVLVSLTLDQTRRFLSGEDGEIDAEIIDGVVGQIQTKSAPLPGEDGHIVLTVSLQDGEVEKLLTKDEHFEDHFLNVLSEQAENANRAHEKYLENKEKPLRSPSARANHKK